MISKLALGASQFRYEGAPVHPRARTPQAEIAEIITTGARAGVRMLDAAVAFDGAESVIGASPSLHEYRLLVRAARGEKGPEHVEREARASLSRLGVAAAEAIIVQNAGELFSRSGPDLWDKLQDLKAQGLFAKIGVVALASDDPLGIEARIVLMRGEVGVAGGDDLAHHSLGRFAEAGLRQDAVGGDAAAGDR